MNKIIALRGRGSSGKSSTIKYLYNILIDKGFKQIEGKSPKIKGDFTAILSKDGIVIGLTSLGDIHNLVYDKLKFLVDNKCLICVSACRTFDKKQPGTNAAIESFNSYEYEYIEKTINNDEYSQVKTNEKDAERILDAINEFYKNII